MCLRLQGPLSSTIVPKAAAIQDTEIPIVINSDHIQICKPASAASPAYLHLKRYLEDRLQALQV